MRSTRLTRMVHESAGTGYQRGAATYASARPSYHPDLINRFVDAFGQGSVVDLGAGTGIFTRQLVAHGLHPIAIEPVADLRLVDEFAVDNPKPSSPDAVAARALSTSFIAALDPTAQQAVVDEILQLTRPLGTNFAFPYRSELQAWVYEPTKQ